MPRIDPQTLLTSGNDPSLKVYEQNLVNIPTLLVSPNIYITNVQETVIEYINSGAPAIPEPAGHDTEVQFNTHNHTGADSHFRFDPSTEILTVQGNIEVTNLKTDHLLYANSNPWTVDSFLPTQTGNTGNVLITNGTHALWASRMYQTVLNLNDISSNIALTKSQITASILTADLVTSNGTLTIPYASSMSGCRLIIINRSTDYNLTVADAGPSTILILESESSIEIISDGFNWTPLS